MIATVFNILRKADRTGWATEEHFVLGAEAEVSARIIVDEKNWSLYSLDLKRNFAWFVQLPDGFDLSQGAFAYSDQHQHAQRLLRLPLHTLAAVAEQCPPPERVIFVFSIGRCGSTLVSRVLNCCPKVWSLSEPMAFPRLIMENYDSVQRLPYPRDKLVTLIRACTRLQFRPPVADGPSVFALKFHSQCLFQADLYREAFPEASFIFLYRDAISWIKSWYKMVLKFGFDGVLAGPTKTMIWNAVTAADDTTHLRPFVDLDAPSLAVEDCAVIGWARNMEEYDRLLAQGVPFLAMRYNELNKDRDASLKQLFAHCGLPTEDVAAGLAAFDLDSQAGTKLAQSVKVEGMTAAQEARARTVLAKHPTHANPDLLLADIYSRKR